MRKHTVRAMTWSLSTAVAVVLLVVGSSVAVADGSRGHGGRSSVSSGRQVQSAGRMGRMVRGRSVRGSRNSVRQGRGGRRSGWFNRDRRYNDRAFFGYRSGSRRGYRSSGFFFGFSFTASEYRRSSGLGYRRDLRREYRSDVPRANDSSVQRAKIGHAPTRSGPMHVPLVASPAAPEVLPLKD